jgi:hypothetical protein
MNSALKSEVVQFYSITFSRTYFLIEIALHLLVLTSIFQLIAFPELVLFVILFSLFAWKFFTNHPFLDQYKSCSMCILKTPPGIRWVESGRQYDYPTSEVKILMTRWFILLQLGRGRFRISRILLADSFNSLDNYSCCRKNIIETKLC